MPLTATFRIVIRNGNAYVRPASEAAAKVVAGDAVKVHFKNLTDDRATLLLPGGVFVGKPNDFQLGLTKKTGAKPEEIYDVVPGAQGLFSYKVFCEQTFTFAQGNSDPEFIVDN